MSYQALLFCPDEKTARVVSQVLSELEFTVEPCNEPFAAVKKLMTQHFDAIVVDCDNEQNAALLYKSARNSESNQASLSVAVVEGQTGVAKAFRLGANLVLTKPIHVEQAKGTLRVARGLLRKGQPVKPAASVAIFPQPAGPPPLPVPVPFPPPRTTAAPPVASASFDLEAEPAPSPDTVDAALLEYMPDSPSSAVESERLETTESPESKQYPWQPRKPMAEPMASALRRAAEVAGRTEFESQPPMQASATHAGSGAAAAPARAKESKVTPFESKSPAPAHNASAAEVSEDPSAAEIWQAHSSAQAAPAPDALPPVELFEKKAGNAGSKKFLVVALVLLGAAGAGYFGWNKMQAGHQQPAPHATPANMQPASLPPTPPPAVTETSAPTAEVVAPTPEQAAGQPSSAPASAKPSAGVLAETPGAKTSAPAKTNVSEEQATAAKPTATVTTEQSQPLVVRNNNAPAPQPTAEAPSQEPEQAPALNSVASDSNNPALSSLVNTTAINASKAAEQTLRISQGVSQGLLIKKVQPAYPEQARQMRMEGTVELQAVISKAGSITGVKQLSGDKILGRAALEAVRQWKYKPYYLSGEPVEVETQITVNFKLP